MFSADISKSEEISTWQPIDKALRIHCDFSATKKFFNNRHKILSEELTFCSAMGSTRSETKHSLTLQGKTDIHTQTDLNKIIIIDYDYYYYYY